MTQAHDVERLRGLIQRAFRRFGALAADTTPCGKPISMVHAHALMILDSRGELSHQALGAELCIDKSNVARLCANLVDAGHAAQRRCETDGRSRKVSLTAKGERLATEVDEASRARFTSLLRALPAESRSGVLQSLELLVGAIEAQSGDLATEGLA